MAVAVDVPDGHGHVYVQNVADAWAAVLQPPGWTPELTAKLRPMLSEQRERLSAGGGLRLAGGDQRVIAADDIGGPVQTEVDQRGGGQA